MPGQTRPTVTKCKLVEVSIVDIGANDDALQLYEPGGKLLTLAAGADNDLLPLLSLLPMSKPVPDTEGQPAAGTDNADNNQTQFSMENILVLLGLAATATESDAIAAITKLQTDAKRTETLELARVEGAVDAAIKANKLTADKREAFISLGKTAGYDHLATALDALTPAVKPMNLINPGSTSHAGGASSTQTYAQMSEAQLQALRADNPEEFARLYKAEFGCEPGAGK